jgi:glycosyltransferase involved in cell wall biosynthesis
MTQAFNDMHAAAPLASVIVPVWNDAERLKRCLDHLRRQTLPPENFEVIVIDNGSTDGSRAVAEAAGGVIVLDEPTPGSYHARNKGLRMARGRIIAFTDADCAPSPDWLEKSLARLADAPDVAILAGAIAVFDEESSGRPSPALLYERAFSFDQKANAARGVSVTANWISPAPVIARAGGFDGALRSGGDFQLSQAIAHMGGRVEYFDGAHVRHPARGSLRALIAKRRRVVGGSWLARRGVFRGPQLLASAVREGMRKTARALTKTAMSPRERLIVVAVVWMLVAVTTVELARLHLGFRPLR